jgi:hypothetical protein
MDEGGRSRREQAIEGNAGAIAEGLGEITRLLVPTLLRGNADRS